MNDENSKLHGQISTPAQQIWKPLVGPLEPDWLVRRLLASTQSDPFNERCIAVTYAFRNTAGHDLGWTDIFGPKAYGSLVNAVTGAILWAIYSIYIDPLGGYE